MAREDIIELFIRGAKIDRRLPDTARPARLKAQALPYRHYQADMNGWGSVRLEEERAASRNERSTRLKTSDIGNWEQYSVLTLWSKTRARRCLRHWSINKAGGQLFRRWCKLEDILVETGRRRKNRAIAQIELSFISNSLQNNANGRNIILHVGPEISDIHVNITDAAQSFTWRGDTAFGPIGVPRDFSWADNRNEMRRQRDAKRRRQPT